LGQNALLDKPCPNHRDALHHFGIPSPGAARIVVSAAVAFGQGALCLLQIS